MNTNGKTNRTCAVFCFFTYTSFVARVSSLCYVSFDILTCQGRLRIRILKQSSVCLSFVLLYLLNSTRNFDAIFTIMFLFSFDLYFAYGYCKLERNWSGVTSLFYIKTYVFRQTINKVTMVSVIYADFCKSTI